MSQQASSTATTTLRKLAYRLLLRLPRLITLVRDMSNTCSEDIAMKALSLAKELYHIEDEAAESEVLHMVNVAKTRHPADAYIVSVSFRFDKFADFEAATFYWQARILLLRLCSRIQDRLPNIATFQRSCLMADCARISSNLLMSWESAFEYGGFGTVRSGTGTQGFALALVMVYGFMAGVDTFRGMSATKVRTWLIQRFNDLTHAKAREQDIDDMAELFAGGPVRGMLPMLLGP